MSDVWRALRVESITDREGVIAALFESGSQGVHEDGDALVTHFQPDEDVEQIAASVARVDPSAVVSIYDAPAVDWSIWRANVGTHQVGNLLVAPPWLAAGHDMRSTIVIDPATAFGTGEHPTTRGMLRLMQRFVRTGDYVADLGAGSAVLSIAAVKLGATRVVAIEIDADAESNAEENMRANGTEQAIRYIVGDATTLLPLLAPIRVLLANIVSSVLMELFPTMTTSMSADGVAVVSGILLEERDLVSNALVRNGLRAVAEDVEGDWLTLAAVKRDD